MRRLFVIAVLAAVVLPLSATQTNPSPRQKELAEKLLKINAPKDDTAEVAVRYSDRLEDDLIIADGAFIQLPVQAKPKPKTKTNAQ